MPQIQLRRDDNVHFNDDLPVRAAAFQAKSARRDDDGASYEREAQAALLLSGRPVDDDRMAFAFDRLHLVLAIAAQGYAKDKATGGGALLNTSNGLDIVEHSVALDKLKDPVIKCLSDALADTGRAYDRHAGIRAEALRLAVAMRLLSLQVEPDPSTEQNNPVVAERPTGGLQKWRLKRVAEYVDSHLAKRVTLSDLAAVAGLSRMHFASQFRLATGLRPHEYLLRQRIRRASELLAQTTMTIVDIALSVGFQTQAHFTTVFKRIEGRTPSQWRNSHHAAVRTAQ